MEVVGRWGAGRISGAGAGPRTLRLLLAARCPFLPRAAHAASHHLRPPGRQPLPVCLFARTSRCHRFRGVVAYGKDHLTRQTFYGYGVPVRLCWPGVITPVCLAVWRLPMSPTWRWAPQAGWSARERTSWKAALTAEWYPHARALLTPFRGAQRDPHPGPGCAPLVSRLRYRLATVFGQLVACGAVKRVGRTTPGPCGVELAAAQAPSGRHAPCHADTRRPPHVPTWRSAAPVGVARRLKTLHMGLAWSTSLES